jgi:hypothetical protein
VKLEELFEEQKAFVQQQFELQRASLKNLYEGNHEELGQRLVQEQRQIEEDFNATLEIVEDQFTVLI